MNSTILKIGVPPLIFTLLTASQARGQSHYYSGFAYTAANGIPTDSALVQLVNPSNDTIWTKVGRLMNNYWNKDSPNGWINNGDTCKIIVTDTTGQQASTFIITAYPSNYVHTLFPGGHGFLIKKVIGNVDSVNARIYSKGAVWSDTLEGRFRIGMPHDDIFFNREKFQRKPALGDSFIIEVSEGSLYARTGGIYERALWDADSAPSCSLQIVGVEENLEKKVHEKGLIIKPNPANNYIVFGSEFNGFLYDVAGKKISSIDAEKDYRLDIKNLPAGIYYIMGERTELDKPKKIIKIR